MARVSARALIIWRPAGGPWPTSAPAPVERLDPPHVAVAGDGVDVVGGGHVVGGVRQAFGAVASKYWAISSGGEADTKRPHMNPTVPVDGVHGFHLSLLTADHNRVRGLFAPFKEAEQAEDADELAASLAEQIATELEVHTRIEEEIFYPEVRKARTSWRTRWPRASRSTIDVCSTR